MVAPPSCATCWRHRSTSEAWNRHDNSIVTTVVVNDD